jgi:hypothetical protein
MFLNLFLILAYLSNIFLLYGSKQRYCFCFLEKVAVPLLIIDLYRFLIIFQKHLNLLYLDHVSSYFKSKLNICHHGFTKSKTTFTNLDTYLDFVTPIVRYRSQADAIYFNLSSASGLVPHALLLHKLTDYGLSASYVNWFHSYVTDRLSHVRYSGALMSPFEVLSRVQQRSVLGLLLFNVFIND